MLEDGERETLKTRIVDKLQSRGMALVAHYYVDGDLDLAEQTGGCVSDSLEMARFGRDCGPRVSGGRRALYGRRQNPFTGKIVFMPTLEAECSLDLGCPPDAFAEFTAQHPNRTVVVYANTSARVKALADWVASVAARWTSSVAQSQGEKILGHQTST